MSTREIDRLERAVALVRERYADFGPTLASQVRVGPFANCAWKPARTPRAVTAPRVQESPPRRSQAHRPLD